MTGINRICADIVYFDTLWNIFDAESLRVLSGMVKQTTYAFCLAALLSAVAGVGPTMAQRVYTSGWTPNYPSTPLPKRGKGIFKVEVARADKPLQQHRMESLTIAVHSASGAPVADASIAVAGLHREVERRMQTAPRVTRNLGVGSYLIEGLNFNMSGLWLLELDIASGTNKDKALLQVMVD